MVATLHGTPCKIADLHIVCGIVLLCVSLSRGNWSLLAILAILICAMTKIDHWAVSHIILNLIAQYDGRLIIFLPNSKFSAFFWGCCCCWNFAN